MNSHEFLFLHDLVRDFTPKIFPTYDGSSTEVGHSDGCNGPEGHLGSNYIKIWKIVKVVFFFISIISISTAERSGL